MAQYTTGELAKECGITVRTVQFYDQKGILVPSARTEGGRRLYSEEDLKKKKPRAKAVTPTPKPRVVKKADSQSPTDALIGTLCPKCGQGHLLKGKTAYGCSRWKEGCDYRVPF